MTKKGKVKWYSEEKGFGFISPENGGHDVFIHSSEVQAAGYETLYKNTNISYIERSFNNKIQAFKIKTI